ncbi:hypothetical protein UF75_0550 [Desulfosporosinus sp. I2]|uniref:DUF3006 domain-containing protein n=1 Tax=Desulfosporosinus sp. I2 TaxID=1617025 RepID=UPI0005EF4BAA|nr:DUF3006 domain-containing protein [Desulfosporosinus sp. I2]KJR49035.1 hypothetical protein UF75_0550 [Desulfosporosinus sp. I2]
MFIIERFEGEWAIIETDYRRTFNLPRWVLPQGIKEGDVISIQVGIDFDATKERAEISKRMLDNLFDE